MAVTMQKKAKEGKRSDRVPVIIENIGGIVDLPAVIHRTRNSQEIAQLRIAFCTCKRFSAWVKIVSALASKVSASISLPRYAGRQCITSAPGLARRTSFRLIW